MTNSWNLLPIDNTIFNLPNANTTKFISAAYINEENLDLYLMITAEYDINDPNNSNNKLKRCAIIRYKKALNSAVYTQDKYWIGDANAGEIIFKGSYSGLNIIHQANGQHYVIASLTAGLVYTAEINDAPNSTSFSVLEKSLLHTDAGNFQSHVDIRDMEFLNNKVYIAHDGGLSVSENLCANKNDWITLNGTGLTAQEVLGFDNTEFDKDYIVCSAFDGNSFLREKIGNTVSFKRFYRSDRYDVSISKEISSLKRFVNSFNGSGPCCDVNLAENLTNDYLPPYALGESSYAFQQFDFDDYNNFYTGTSDVYRFDDYWNNTNQADPAQWINVSKSNRSLTLSGRPFDTKGVLSASKFIVNKSNENIITSIYAIKDYSQYLETPVKLVLSNANITNKLNIQYNHKNISPYNVTNTNQAPSALYENWIQDIEIDEDDINKIWVCFGGTSTEIEEVSGKVYYTSNANSTNPTWVDISAGLPKLPILSLEYWKGSDDIIFAGTDVGVYVYNKSLNKWEEFMTNFPFITVPKLDINYCSNTLRACTSGYGIWETPLPILNANQLKPIEVASDEVWNTTRDTYRNVLVKNGATLTIQGVHDNSTNTNSVEIRIPKNNKIMVEAGGKIIISGATLTYHCDFWQGIEVYGNKSLAQTDNNQGHIIIKDGSIIENANIGIRTYKSNGSGWELTSTGGIITCFNTTFRNNQKDIEIYPYTKPSTKKTEQPAYRGNISKCNFITTDAYFTPSVNPIHISLWRINSININGCLFEDKRETSFGSIGVNSIFSGFNINEYCVGKTQVPVASSSPCNGTATTFKTMQYAVYSIGMNNPRYSINISNTNFENCSRSIYLNGISNASIFKNNFSIVGLSQMSTDPYISSQYGVYLDMCRAYKIEENNFNGNFPSGPDYKSVGLIIRNLHGENTQIYRNNFYKLYICIETIGQNVGADRNLGLQFKCNEFIESECHVYVGLDPFANPNVINLIGIAENQGLPNALNTDQLAGNIFRYSPPESKYHIFNNGNHINYFHHSPSTNYQFLNPFNNTSNVTTIDEELIFNPLTSCPSSFTNNFTSEQLRIFAINQEAQLEENIIALTELLDAGSTEDFIAQLDIFDASKVNTNYFLLMNVAPYVSNNVIKLVIDNNSPFTNAMIRNILVVCSQAAKDPEILDLLNSRNNPLPQYMRDQIAEGTVNMSEMELDLRDIGAYKFNIDNSIFETIWRATQDTTDLSNDIFEIFNEIDNNSLKLHLIEWLDASEKYTEANAVLSNMINDVANDEDEYRNLELFQQSRNLINSFETNNIDYTNLSSQLIDELQPLIYEPHASISTIFGLLKLNNSLDYSEPVLFLEEEESNLPLYKPTKNLDSKNTSLDPSEESLKISPNPGSDLITIKYNVLTNSSNLELVITNTNGIVLHTQKLKNHIDEIILKINNFKSGNYIVSIRGEGLKTISEKLMIVNK